MDAVSLTRWLDRTAEEILEAAALDGLPLMGKLWTLRVEDDEIVLRIRAGLNNTEVPRQPPPPPPDPEPDPPPPPPPPPPDGD